MGRMLKGTGHWEPSHCRKPEVHGQGDTQRPLWKDKG